MAIERRVTDCAIFVCVMTGVIGIWFVSPVRLKFRGFGVRSGGVGTAGTDGHFAEWREGRKVSIKGRNLKGPTL